MAEEMSGSQDRIEGDKAGAKAQAPNRTILTPDTTAGGPE